MLSATVMTEAIRVDCRCALNTFICNCNNAITDTKPVKIETVILKIETYILVLKLEKHQKPNC